jgi:hypothetical protein
MKEESTNAHKGGGLSCSTYEAGIISRGGKEISQSTANTSQLGNQEELLFNVYV